MTDGCTMPSLQCIPKYWMRVGSPWDEGVCEGKGVEKLLLIWISRSVRLAMS